MSHDIMLMYTATEVFGLKRATTYRMTYLYVLGHKHVYYFHTMRYAEMNLYAKSRTWQTQSYIVLIKKSSMTCSFHIMAQGSNSYFIAIH